MVDRFSRSKAIILLTGIVMVALGIAVLVNPIAALGTLIRVMGIVLIAIAVAMVVPAFMRGNPLQDARFELALGIISAIVGLAMVIAPESVASFVWTIIGIIILATGLLDIVEAGAYRRVGSPLGIPATASGAICVVLGVLVIVAPLASPTLGMLVAAVALLIDGVTEIIFALGM